MAFKLKEIIPWGRNLSEYKSMFSLGENDLKKKIIDCGGGPSSFSAEMKKRGNIIISVDPLYQFTKEEIRQRISETYDIVLDKLIKDQDSFVWKEISSPQELGKLRMNAMTQFLDDYVSGKKENRYQIGSLPNLSFPDKKFDIALCSHFLFLYSDKLTFDFHLQSIVEMRRIAKEVRIFPLLDLSGKRSKHLKNIEKQLDTQGYQVEIKKVSYEFQKSGNEMMRVVKKHRY